jgi:glycosyltransferase involved in cell wall biosynthesis
VTTILQVIPKLDQGGAERATVDIARALRGAGFRALVASEGGALESELAQAGGGLVRMNVASKNPLVILWNALRLARLIRWEDVSLIHARSRAPAWSALLAARITGIPFVTTYHGIYNAKSGLKRWYNSVMARGDAVIANSEWTARHIRETYAFIPKNLVTIPRGIEFERFDPTRVPQIEVSALRHRWANGVPDARIVLLPGRLTRWKGQAVFLEALGLLAKFGRLPRNARAVMVGEDQGRTSFVAELEALIAQHGLQKVALIAGGCDNMPAAYLASDIVVSASTDPEAFGRVTAEASAMGRPVIATDHGGSQETVLRGKSGLLVPPGDAAALADAIHDLLSRSPEALAAMGAAGRAHIAANFTLETMCRDTLTVYRRLLAR